MRAGDLSTGATRLQHSWKKLLAHWEETKLSWTDNVSHEFEENYLAAFEPQITSTLERMRTLDAVFNAAQNDCER